MAALSTFEWASHNLERKLQVAGGDGPHSARRQGFGVSVVCVDHPHLSLRGRQDDSTVPEIITWKHSRVSGSYIQRPLPLSRWLFSYISITHKLTPRHLISSQNIQIKYMHHLSFFQTPLKSQAQNENDIKSQGQRTREDNGMSEDGKKEDAWMEMTEQSSTRAGRREAKKGPSLHLKCPGNQGSVTGAHHSKTVKMELKMRNGHRKQLPTKHLNRL